MSHPLYSDEDIGDLARVDRDDTWEEALKMGALLALAVSFAAGILYGLL